MILLNGVLLGLAACESTALSLDDPAADTMTLEPAFIEGGSQEIEVVAELGVADPDNTEGDALTWAVQDQDFGEDLTLVAWAFETNFRVRLLIRRAADAAAGSHELVLRINNTFGTFVARGEFFIFP